MSELIEVFCDTLGVYLWEQSKDIMPMEWEDES
jgi:hypothetical protein